MVPMLAARCPSALQIWRVKAATDVLPLVPVTAAMVPGWRGKNAAAASASARRAFFTVTKATVSGRPSRRCSAATATAPAATACLAKWAPSALAPAMATNRSPGLTLRLSEAMPPSSTRAKRAS